MRRRMIVSILIGLSLILSTFISTMSIVQKIAYAQARMEPSIIGVRVPNSMTQRSTAVGSNAEPGRNSAVQGVAGALSSLHGSFGVGTMQPPSCPNPGSLACNAASAVAAAAAAASHAAIIAGVVLAAASFIKLHQHHQNPQLR